MIEIKINSSFLKIDEKIEEHNIYGLYGKSGSGKTTFFQIFSGLVKEEAFIRVGDEIWQDNKHFLKVQQREIGYVFQKRALFPNMNVLENLLFVKKDINLAKRLLEMVEAGDLLHRDVKTLSGGEAQRVEIARALMKGPKILLLDESFSALDYETKFKIQEEIKQIHKEFKLTIFFISHHLEDISNLAQFVLKFENGRIISREKVSEYTQLAEIKGNHIKIDEEILKKLNGVKKAKIKIIPIN
ncbi:MAG: ATP-binding cassette domain-containing protein [Epsilonproteobacteria bacterium]|nr:ATP-binding cassette domain-containing protein [Campylobacterota bacterium]